MQFSFVSQLSTVSQLSSDVSERICRQDGQLQKNAFLSYVSETFFLVCPLWLFVIYELFMYSQLELFSRYHAGYSSAKEGWAG